MSRYLDPKADVVFKKIFADHPKILISFLNAVLPLPSDSPIVELTYLPAEQVPDIPEFRHTVVDVKCKDAKKRVFIVEMQMNWTDTFKRRLLFGASQAFVKQLNKGEGYNLLEPVYGLGIVAQAYDPSPTQWYHHYQLVKKGSLDGEVIDHLQLVFIELPKFPVHSTEEKKLRLLWLRFLREIDERTRKVPQELLQIPEIAQAIELSEEAAYTPAQLESYQGYWDAVSREKTLISVNYAKGKEEGRAEGKAEGEIRGRIAARREIAKQMLQRGLKVEDVAHFIGLTEAEVELLQAEIKLRT